MGETNISMHDLLSLGEIHAALDLSSGNTIDERDTLPSTAAHRRRDVDAEAIRLPLLIRLLSALRPLASLPFFAGKRDQLDETSYESITETDGKGQLDAIVSLLEQVAAYHHAAESVEAVSTHYAPQVTQDIGVNRIVSLHRSNDIGQSRLPRDESRTRGNGAVVRTRKWDTVVLEDVLAGRRPEKTKRRKEMRDEAKAANGPADSVVTSDDEDSEKQEGDREMMKKAEVVQIDHDVLANSAAEDPPPAQVSKALKEIISLILSALDPIDAPVSIHAPPSAAIIRPNDSRSDDGKLSATESSVDAVTGSDAGVHDPDNDDDDAGVNVSVALKVKPDSALAEPSPVVRTGHLVEEDEDIREENSLRNSLHATELTSTISSLMYNAPVLRHRHLAYGLCRAAVPQASAIIYDLASNCPPATACLLAGCIDAVSTAYCASGNDIAKSKIVQTAKKSTKAIAALSKSEAWRVINTLTHFKVMRDVALEEIIHLDTGAAVSMMFEDLNRENQIETAMWDSVDAKNKKKGKSFQRRKINLSNQVRCAFASVHESRPWLVKSLLESDSLATKVRKYLSKSLQELGSDDQIASGRSYLLLQTYSLLIYRIGIGSGSSAGSGTAFVQASIEGVNALFNRSGQDSRLRMLCICACLITCANFPPIAAGKETFINTPASLSAAACLRSLLKQKDGDNLDVFVSQLSSLISSEDSSELEYLVISSISVKAQKFVTEESADSFFNTCRWAREKMGARIEDEWSASTKIEVLTVGARRGAISSTCLANCVAGILDDPAICSKVFLEPCISELLREAVATSLGDGGTKLPIIFPLSLETILLQILELKLSWTQPGTYSLSELGKQCQFILQLLYALIFLDRSTSSPFAIDPRCFPLSESLTFCQQFPSSSVLSELTALVERLAPEVICLQSPHEPSSLRLVLDEHISPQLVCSAIEDCNGVETDIAFYGLRAERLFVRARAANPVAHIDTEVACALLASDKHLPRRTYTYRSLCRDPLVMLKCNLRIWKCRGLRRITLSILQRLLLANDHIVKEQTQHNESATQLLAARNLLVARCLLVAGSTGFDPDAENAKSKARAIRCPMTVSFIRSLLSDHLGLTAQLLKQGLPHTAVDWMVDVAPECLQDANLLTDCLSSNNGFTAAERLGTADASLRIAVAYGRRDEACARILTRAALNVLVSSFLLSLGPIGLPVSVVHEEEDGVDVAQTCRTATFRMLAALQSIGDDRIAIRGEARMALNKMAAMCKNESAVGAIPRRKVMLKEIWDAVLRCSSALGF
jgi:hypothetical protein